MSERELYQEHYKTSRDYKFYIKHEMSEKQIFEFKNGKYVVDCVNDGWNIWQASANRQGYKLVPTTPTMKVYDRLFAEHDLDEDRVTYIYKDIMDAVG